MSNDYCKKTGIYPEPTTTPGLRVHCQRPGRRDADGNIVYFTEQAHKKNCDVRTIVDKYAKTGLIDHVSTIEGQYGDMTGMDYKTALDKVLGAQKLFRDLPSHVRKRFRNSPEHFLEFFDNPENRDEAIKLGLIDSRWTPETDGIGEHVPAGGNVIKEPASEPEK